MSTNTHHLGVAHQRSDAVDTARLRGRGEGHAVVSSVAGRGLIPGLFVLCSVLGFMVGQAADLRDDDNRREILAGTPGKNPLLARSMYFAARRGQPDAPGLGSPAMPVRQDSGFS